MASAERFTPTWTCQHCGALLHARDVERPKPGEYKQGEGWAHRGADNEWCGPAVPIQVVVSSTRRALWIAVLALLAIGACWMMPEQRPTLRTADGSSVEACERVRDNCARGDYGASVDCAVDCSPIEASLRARLAWDERHREKRQRP